jgi:hypothetical protein
MTDDKVAQEQDWLDRMIDRLHEWLDSLKEKDEAQNLGEWSYSVEKKRQGEEKTSSN